MSRRFIPCATVTAAERVAFQPGLTIAAMLDAIVWFGDTTDVVVPAAAAELRTKYGAELERRERLLDEASKLQVRP